MRDDELFDPATGEFVQRKLHSFRAPGRARVMFNVEGPSRTKQEFAAECDINTIMARYQKTGVISHYSGVQPSYVDFSDAPDFHSAMNLMIEAEKAFMGLPATARRAMDNDPQAFVSFASDPANIDKMREWGLAPPAPKKPLDAPPASAGGATPPPGGEAPKAP